MKTTSRSASANLNSGTSCTSTNSAESLLRRILPYYLLFIFTGTVAGAVYGFLIRDGWMMGDWLINYQGGMIRRGLLGEVIYQLSGLTHTSPGIFVLSIQLGLYGVFFLCSYLLLRQQQRLLPYCLLIFSPFVFTFQINSIEGGFRKEVLFVGLFSFFVYLANSVSQQRFQIAFVLLLLLYPLLILSHEMLALLLPYFLIVYFSRQVITARSILSTLILLIPAMLSTLASLRYSGTQLQVDTIKQSLSAIHFEIIGGAVDWLAFSITIGLSAVKGFIVDKFYLQYYGLATVLAAFAYIPVSDGITRIINNRLLVLLLILTLLGAAALFAVAIDWGRFLYMHLIALFLLTLLLPSDSIASAQPSTLNYKGNRFAGAIAVVALLLYSQTWFIPHCCEAQPWHSSLNSLNVVSLFKPYLALAEWFSK